MELIFRKKFDMEDLNLYCSRTHNYPNLNIKNCIGVVMVSALASSAIDRRFEPWSGQTKDYKIGIFCFSVKHAALRRKSKDWSARNHNNVSEWSDMSTRGLLFQWASTIKIQLSVLIENKADLIIISLNIYLDSPWYSWIIAELSLNNNHSPRSCKVYSIQH